MTQTSDATDKVYTVLDIANLLDCSKNHVYRLIGAGVLRAVDISVPGSNRVKFRILGADLREYLAKTGNTE